MNSDQREEAADPLRHTHLPYQHERFTEPAKAKSRVAQKPAATTLIPYQVKYIRRLFSVNAIRLLADYNSKIVIIEKLQQLLEKF